MSMGELGIFFLTFHLISIVPPPPPQRRYFRIFAMCAEVEERGCANIDLISPIVAEEEEEEEESSFRDRAF